MWGSGQSNFGQAYKLGDAQNPFFRMQGMLPQAGLQPGSLQGMGGGMGAPILGKPMLPPGVTPEQAALPQGIPGLGAPLGKAGGAGAGKPAPVTTKVTPPKYFGGRTEDDRRDHSRGDGPGQRGPGKGSNRGGGGRHSSGF